MRIFKFYLGVASGIAPWLAEAPWVPDLHCSSWEPQLHWVPIEFMLCGQEGQSRSTQDCPLPGGNLPGPALLSLASDGDEILVANGETKQSKGVSLSQQSTFRYFLLPLVSLERKWWCARMTVWPQPQASEWLGQVGLLVPMLSPGPAFRKHIKGSNPFPLLPGKTSAGLKSA